jgi:hypothetical protein
VAAACDWCACPRTGGEIPLNAVCAFSTVKSALRNQSLPQHTIVLNVLQNSPARTSFACLVMVHLTDGREQRVRMGPSNRSAEGHAQSLAFKRSSS